MFVQYILLDKAVVIPFSVHNTCSPHTIFSFNHRILPLPHPPNQALSSQPDKLFGSHWGLEVSFSWSYQQLLSPEMSPIYPFCCTFSSYSALLLFDRALYNKNILASFCSDVQQVSIKNSQKLLVDSILYQYLRILLCFSLEQQNYLLTSQEVSVILHQLTKHNKPLQVWFLNKSKKQKKFVCMSLDQRDGNSDVKQKPDPLAGQCLCAA